MRTWGLVLEPTLPVSIWNLLCKPDGTCRNCGYHVQNLIFYPKDIMVRHDNELHFCHYTFAEPTKKETDGEEVLVP